jgi:hypothetical protein
MPEPVPEPVIDSCALLQVTYTKDIAPLISANCSTPNCHSNNFYFGDFTTYSGLRIKVDNGTFYYRVFTTRNMPLNGSLSHTQLQKIQCWLDAGTPNN